MSYESEWKRMIGGSLYCPFKILDDSWNDVHKAQKEFNESEFWQDALKEYEEYAENGD